ncbi:hypothetical protein KAM576c_20310 [Enterobacter asburiae]|nr:hypothetical protein KAM576c_20310 [Enterobacter asburiae]
MFAAMLIQHLEPGDIGGRLGGDEFSVLIAEQNRTDTFLQGLRKCVDDYNASSGKPYNINYSFGMLHNDPIKYPSLGEMLKESDEVMYSAKRRKHT